MGAIKYLLKKEREQEREGRRKGRIEKGVWSGKEREEAAAEHGQSFVAITGDCTEKVREADSVLRETNIIRTCHARGSARAVCQPRRQDPAGASRSHAGGTEWKMVFRSCPCPEGWLIRCSE